MSDETPEKKSHWLKKFFKICLLSPVNILFVLALAYYGTKAYYFNPSIMNKAIFLGIVALWGLWFIAKHMMMLLIVIGILGGGAYLWYDLSQKEARKCEESGGFWNENTRVCEEKVSFTDKVKKFIDEQRAKFERKN